MTGLYKNNSDVDWYSDALGHDLEQDHRWEDVDPSGYYPDPSLAEWPRPYRSVARPPVHAEDFDPAGLPDLPTRGTDTPGAAPRTGRSLVRP